VIFGTIQSDDCSPRSSRFQAAPIESRYSILAAFPDTQPNFPHDPLRDLCASRFTSNFVEIHTRIVWHNSSPLQRSAPAVGRNIPWCEWTESPFEVGREFKMLPVVPPENSPSGL